MPPPEFITQFAASTPQNGYVPGRASLICLNEGLNLRATSYQHFSISAPRVRIEGSRHRLVRRYAAREEGESACVT
jgi:hypothetical protein